jgi:hypothetical protein
MIFIELTATNQVYIANSEETQDSQRYTILIPVVWMG